jgi:hypothetical protein
MTIGATQFATGDGAVVKLWSDRIYEDTSTDGGLLSTLRSDGVLVEQQELSRGAGDYVKMHLLSRLSNPGFKGSASSSGLEQSLNYNSDALYIDELRNAVKVEGKGHISAQRVKFNMDEDAYTVQKNWSIDRMIVSSLNQLAGNAATSITYDSATYSGTGGSTDTTGALQLITGMNAVTDPSSNQIIRANSQASDNAVGSDTTATFHLGYIIQAENKARKNRPYIVPCKGKTKYRCIIHTDAYQQLVQDTTFAIQFRDIYLNMIAGGKNDATIDNQSFDFSMTTIIVTDKIPNGQTSGTANANTRRAVFCGQEAGVLAFGQGYSLGGKTTPGFSFEQQSIEGGKWMVYYITCIYGIKKAIYNSVDRGTIAIVHYVA